ncbi:hypothetical protein [uncultured Acetobacteroides sp.]|uniref:hypothetical protein n=1 Tax=uncultured Acetobacteroides sp. TaxID=1760811 RepID=UPI0029F5B973|nr:hypothetical protein [uncultured Acetobacteroides sp.]
MPNNLSFEEVLCRTCNKVELQAITEVVCQHPERIDELWVLANSTIPNAWRAAWALAHINERNRQLLTPYLAEIADIVTTTKNLSIKRELLKILILHPLPDEPSGTLLDDCFGTVTSNSIPVGVRMYAMSMVAKYYDRYPELTPEFLAILEDILAEPPSVGMKGWAKRLTQQLSQNQK